MTTFPAVGFISKIRNVLPIPLLRLLPQRRTQRSKVRPFRDEGAPITQATVAASPHPSSTVPTPPSIVSQNGATSYYSLAQRLQKLLPPNVDVLGADDVLILETTPFSSGGFSDLRKASIPFRGRHVAVKSLRCYSSPEFDPAEVGIVSFYPSYVGWTTADGVQSGSSGRCGHLADCCILTLFHSLACFPPPPTHSLSFTR